MLRIQVYFADSAGGWSETYYSVDTDPLAFVNTAAQQGSSQSGNAHDLMVNRANLLNYDSSIAGVRASVFGSFRNAVEADVHGLYDGYRFPKAKGAAESDVALLVKLGASTGSKQVQSRLYLSGLPEFIIGTTNAYTPVANWPDYMTPFKTMLGNGQWKLVPRPDKQDKTVTLPITYFTTSSNNIATIGPVVGAPSAGDFVKIVVSGVKYPRGWNGNHTAKVVTISGPSPLYYQFTVPKKLVETVPVWDASANGTVRLAGQTPFSINYTQDARIVFHKRGRFFEQLRGRLSRV